MFFLCFLTLFRSDFGTESKRNKNPEMIFSQTEEVQGAFGPRQVGSREPTSPHSATMGEAAVGRLVASLAAPSPRSLAYKFPNVPQKIRGASKILFRRRKLPFPRDLIWRPFPARCWRGLWSWRASSSSSSSPLQ